MAAVLAFIETHDGKLKKSAGEVMGQAQRLAGPLGGGIDAVIVGAGIAGLADDVAALGADRVFVADSDALKTFTIDGFAPAVAQAVSAASPKLVLMAASVNG